MANIGAGQDSSGGDSGSDNTTEEPKWEKLGMTKSQYEEDLIESDYGDDNEAGEKPGRYTDDDPDTGTKGVFDDEDSGGDAGGGGSSGGSSSGGTSDVPSGGMGDPTAGDPFPPSDERDSGGSTTTDGSTGGQSNADAGSGQGLEDQGAFPQGRLSLEGRLDDEAIQTLQSEGFDALSAADQLRVRGRVQTGVEKMGDGVDDVSVTVIGDELAFFEGGEVPEEDVKRTIATDFEREFTQENPAFDEGDVAVAEQDGQLTLQYTESGQEQAAAQQLGVGVDDIDVEDGQIVPTSKAGEQALAAMTPSEMFDPMAGDPFNQPQGGQPPATDPYEEIERELENQLNADLDDGDITFSQDGDTISGQLSPEGEREVAAQNAPFQGTVFGGITSAGARAGVRFSQFREENVERAQEVTGVDNLFGGEGEFISDVREFGLDPLRDAADGRGTPGARGGGIESQLADRISAGIEDAAATAFDSSQPTTAAERANEASTPDVDAAVGDVRELSNQLFDSSQPTTPAERSGGASTPELGNAVDAVQSAVDPFVGMDRATTPAERTGGAGDIPTTPAELFGAEEQDVPEVSGGTLPVFSGVGAGGAGGVGRATQAAGAATGLGLVGLGAAATTEQPEASAEVPVPDEGTFLPQQEQGVSSTTGTFADEVPVPDPTAVEDFGVPEQGIEIGPTDDPRSTTEMDPGGATAPDEFAVPTESSTPFLSTSPQQIQQGTSEGVGEAVERTERSQERSVVPDSFIPDGENLLGRDYGGSLEYNRGGNFVGRNYDPSRTLPSAEEIFFGAGETPGVQERQDAAQASEVTAGQGVGSALDPFANVAADVGAAEDVASRPATGVRAQQFTVPRVQIDAFQRPVETGEPTAMGNPVGYPAEPAQGTPTIPFDLTPPPSSSRKPPWGLPGLDGSEDVYSEQAGGARGEIFTGFRDPLTGDPL